jgi:hypothetical protein
VKISNFGRSTLVHWVQQVKDGTAAETNRSSKQCEHYWPSGHFRTVLSPIFREIIDCIFNEYLSNEMRLLNLICNGFEDNEEEQDGS